MIKKLIFCFIALISMFIIPSCAPSSQFVNYRPRGNRSTADTIPGKDYSSINCGPKVLLKVCQFYDIPATEDELITLSDTKSGLSSFLGLAKAAKAKGLECIGAETDFEHLKELKRDNQLVVHFNENNHFVLIMKIGDKTVTIYDPALAGNRNPEVPMHLFLNDWDGNVLIFNKDKRSPS